MELFLAQIQLDLTATVLTANRTLRTGVFMMRASVSSKAPVPSKSLLRFLRSQSESEYLTVHPTLSALRSNADTKALSAICGRRHLSTTTHRKARGQASYLDELWPRHRESTPKALPPPRHYRDYHHGHRTARGSKELSHNRHASTSQRPGFFRRLFAARDSQETEPESNTIPDVPFNNQQYEDTSAQLFNLSRTLSRSPSGADLKLRCTEFDANGSVTLVSGEFKKSELIAKYGLLPRDLRKIDSSVLPHILVRPSAILLNLLHLRVLIQSDRVLVFDAYGSTDSYTQSLFMYDLEGKLRQKPDPRAATNGSGTYLPYELRALEAVLISATSGLEAEFTLVRDPVVRVLRALESDIDREKLRHLLIHSKKLGTFEQKARLVRDAINDLLEADDDLAAMYLTERKNTGKSRPDNDHQEVEMLLESYHKICDEIVEISGNLISNIRNTEEVIKAILDANRNQLMLLDIKFSIGTLGLAGGTLVAGLYGMNLENFIEESEVAFGGVTGICLGLSAIIAVYGMRKLHNLQKVRMWGEQGSDALFGGGSRGNWRNEAMEHAAENGNRADRLMRMKAEKTLGGASGMAGIGGPVLWPGMDGLGMHKLERGERETGIAHPEDQHTAEPCIPSSRSQSDREGPSVTIHDDILEQQREGMMERKKKLKEKQLLRVAEPPVPALKK